MKNRFDREEITAIAVSFLVAIPLCVAFWWIYNFSVFVYDGTTIPMWVSFNHWVVGLFA
jgi:hypothetical protein